MIKADLVSIITPVHNCEKFIKDTIDSVRNQSYTNWEHILIDDVSTDNSYNIIKDLCSLDSRFKLVQLDKNGGAAVARNTGIELAKGRYIAFLDSDDLWHKEKLKKQVRFMSHNKYALTFTSYEKFYENGYREKVTCPTSITYSQLLRSNKIGCLVAMYDVSMVGKVYMPLIRKRQDYALWLKMLKLISAGYGLDEVLAYYRIRNDSISANKAEMLKWNWRLFHNVEKLNIIESAFYLAWNVLNKIKSSKG